MVIIQLTVSLLNAIIKEKLLNLKLTFELYFPW